MSKELVYGDDARREILKGVERLARAVSVTLGPSGKNVLISNKKTPIVTKDGITVAKSITLKDELQNQGALLVKQVAGATNVEAGDGTTTATVLAHEIYRRGFRLVSSGTNPMDVKRGIDQALEEALGHLEQVVKPINTLEEVQHVATISTNNDPGLGELIGTAVHRIGSNGSIIVENSGSAVDSVSYVEGVQVERGYLSRAFITDEARLKVDYENAWFLIVEEKVDSILPYLKVFEHVIKEGKKLIFMVDAIEESALALLEANRKQKNLNVCVTHTPGFGEDKHDMVEDLASVLGATVVSSDFGLSPREVEPSHLGHADRVVVSANDMVIRGGLSIEKRVATLQAQCEHAEGFLKSKIRDRLNKLSSKVAVIKLGAHSESELREKKYRVEDAINATRAAMEDGIVAGGGATLAKIARKLNVRNYPEYDVLKDALTAPLAKILENAGAKGHILDEVQDAQDDWGYDAKKGDLCPLIERGIIDPVRVTRSALTNAASVASIMLTNDCVIIDEVADE